MRRVLYAIAAVLVLAACTPAEIAHWSPFAAPLDTAAEVPCDQWIGTARVAGFDDSQIPTLLNIMWRESRCDPTQQNPNGGASGLVQIMPMWADDCGGYPVSLFDPQFNLNCAMHILHVQGWGAWAT